MAKVKRKIFQQIKFEYVEPTYDSKEPFGHYNALNEYQKRVIYATNFWRLASGREIIAVPDDNLEYWSRWNSKIEQQAKDIFIKKTKLHKL